MLSGPIGFHGHSLNTGFDFPPEFVIQEARNPWLGLALPLSGQGERIPRQIPGIDQPGKERIQNDNSLSLTGRRQRAGERSPVRLEPRPFSTSFHDPALGRLRIVEKTLVDQQVFVGQGGERFAEFDHRPQQQTFRFLAVAGERRWCILSLIHI